MRIWDTSALVPLILDEPKSEQMRAVFAGDPEIVTSALTPVEIASAVWRRRHAGKISVAAHQDADLLFANLSTSWLEYPLTQDTIDAAIGVMSRYALRAGDALQLGSALVAAGETEKPHFVTLDEDLKAAARGEGFPVLP